MEADMQGAKQQASEQLRQARNKMTLRDQERIASLAIGAGSLLYGLRRGGVMGVAVGAMGALLTYRGLVDDRADTQHFTVHLTIDRAPEDLYQFWHGFTRLPQVLNYITDIRSIQGEQRTHWVAEAPGGATVEWDAEVTEDVPNERIAWRTLEGADISNWGSIRFRPAPAGRGTEVELELHYEPPGGMLSKTLVRFLNSMTAEAAREDLRRFKRLMETGEVPTASRAATGSQASGTP